MKLAGFDAARDALSAAVVELVLAGDHEPVVARLETEALPRLAGLIRWAEALPDRRTSAA